jgi:hypothetical protein
MGAMLAFALERRNHLIGCAWFWAWAVIGAAFAFGFISFLGVLTLLPTLVLAFILWRLHPVNWFGGVTGIGVMFLVIAYIQRSGEFYDPVHWLVAGLVFFTAGVAGHAWVSARSS